MAEANEILELIHKADPVPAGKINKKSKIENKLKQCDNALSNDIKPAAKFIYDLIIDCFKLKGKPFYNSEMDASTSEALKQFENVYNTSIRLREADEEQSDEPKEDAKKGTKRDEKFKVFAQNLLNPETDFVYSTNILKAFAYDIDKEIEVVSKGSNGEEIKAIKTGGTVGKLFGTIKNKEDQTAFIRSANHYKAIITNKTGDYYFDGISKMPGFDSFKKVFPEVSENYEHNHFNGDVDTGINPYVINAYIGLINSSIKIMNPDGTDKGKFQIKPITIPKDKVEADKESNIKNGTKTINNQMQSVLTGLFQGAVRAMLRNESLSIKSLAIALRESTVTIEDKWIAKVAEQNPEFNGKTFAMLNQDWKGDHYKQMDSRDAQVLQNLNGAISNDGMNFKRYWDSMDEKQRTDLLDTLSRQVYLATNGKTTLQSWDKNQNWLCLQSCKEFDNFVMGPELDNRNQDKDDLDEYNANRDDSGIDDLVYILKGIEEGTAKDEQGNLIVSPDEFEQNYPTMTNDNELIRVVGVIASAQPDIDTPLSEELGSVSIPQETINVFKQLNQNIQEEVKSNRINLYQKINVLLGNGEKEKAVSCAGNEELFNNAKAMIKKADTVYELKDFGKVKFSEKDLETFNSITEPTDLKFIQAMSKAKMNADNDISNTLKFKDIAPNMKPAYMEWEKLKNDFIKSVSTEMETYTRDLETLAQSSFANPDQPTEDETKAYEEALNKRENEFLTKIDEYFKPFVESTNEVLERNNINYKVLSKSYSDKDTLNQDTANLKNIFAGKGIPDQAEGSENKEGSENVEGSDNKEPSDSLELEEPEVSEQPEEKNESIKDFADYLKKLLG